MFNNAIMVRYGMHGGGAFNFMNHFLKGIFSKVISIRIKQFRKYKRNKQRYQTVFRANDQHLRI